VFTYSPSLGRFEADDSSEFVLPYAMNSSAVVAGSGLR
jgi:hypothetical protein